MRKRIFYSIFFILLILTGCGNSKLIEKYKSTKLNGEVITLEQEVANLIDGAEFALKYQNHYATILSLEEIQFLDDEKISFLQTDEIIIKNVAVSNGIEKVSRVKFEDIKWKVSKENNNKELQTKSIIASYKDYLIELDVAFNDLECVIFESKIIFKSNNIEEKYPDLILHKKLNNILKNDDIPVFINEFSKDNKKEKKSEISKRDKKESITIFKNYKIENVENKVEDLLINLHNGIQFMLNNKNKYVAFEDYGNIVISFGAERTGYLSEGNKEILKQIAKELKIVPSDVPKSKLEWGINKYDDNSGEVIVFSKYNNVIINFKANTKVNHIKINDIEILRDNEIIDTGEAYYSWKFNNYLLNI